MSTHTKMFTVLAESRSGVIRWSYLDRGRAEYQYQWANEAAHLYRAEFLVEELDITHYDVDRTYPKVCASDGCANTDLAGVIKGQPYCELCFDGLTEYYADQEGPDPHGDRDPTPEEQAGWAMQDKIDMYRNEY